MTVRVRTGNAKVDDAVNSAFSELGNIVDAKAPKRARLVGVLLYDGQNEIPHGLGRIFQGWSITRQYTDALTDPGRIREWSTARAATHLQLESLGFGGDITVDIEVF